MTTPRNKNWPEVQTVDGAVGVTGGLVMVQNPAPMGMPIPLIVQEVNPVASMVVTPLVGNHPCTNGFLCDVPDDGSAGIAELSGAMMTVPPYTFRDTRRDGDVREFCGGFVPAMRLYWANPLNYELVLTITNKLGWGANVMHDAGGIYPMPLGQPYGYIDMLGCIQVPSFVDGSVTHEIGFEVSCPGGHVEAKYDVFLILCSHYDVEGVMPA